MMSSSLTTKNWGTAQEQKLPTEKGNKMSAAGENPFGDKDLGTVLNEIADPNFVEAKKVQRENKSELDKDAFFKLMLTQMKNQDPMNPMQSHEMAAHLAQFTSLEQMFNVNENLEAMRKMQTPLKDYQALSFIGKEISADSSSIVRYKDDKSHELRFALLGDATEAKVMIKNEAGDTIRILKLADLKKGNNFVRWDGVNDSGQTQGEGEYKFVVEALSSSGTKVAVDTTANGRITGVQFTKKGPMLLVGSQQVYLADVKKILEGNDVAGANSAAAVGEVAIGGLGPSANLGGASGQAVQATNSAAIGKVLPNGLSMPLPGEVPKAAAQPMTKTIPQVKREKIQDKPNVSMKPPSLKRAST